MASEKELALHKRRRRKKPVVAVEDELLRDQLAELLGHSKADFEVVDPDVDPLSDPPEKVADLLILRRSSVRPEDLRKLDRYTNRETNPDLVIITDGAEDIDRARLLMAGVSGVIESNDSEHHLRETMEAITNAEGSALRDPHADRDGNEPRLGDFHSRSPRMRRFLQLVDRVVDTDSSLLITGETGVGKERLAQAIHNEGPRRDAPFITVNCGAIPEPLLESELFGHESGAFTGAARRKKGRFELANRGTIFLDEIGEMPLHLQVNLLSVLQRRSLQRVGGEQSLKIDVRVMAATNRDLAVEVREGRFREDLYYRLSVVPLEIPPLRERSDDIADMVGSFIRHFRATLRRERVDSITAEALDALTRCSWPGNVRQLINAVEHSIVMCRTSHISVQDLPESVTAAGLPASMERAELSPKIASKSTAPPFEPLETWLDRPLREARKAFGLQFERAYLDALLTRSGGRIRRTAESAGITPRSLYDKLKHHGLRKEDYR